uniref:Protein phosphatase, Mg2+/Mn2+ dependent 1K n=1 Tax=Lates calcarifer TaxID=8187 RepID=A0A4W6BTX1_LATCA
MSSTVLLNLLRCGGCRVGVRQASSSVRFDSDGSGRPVTWDSFGIWDNRIEEPILLPSSIRYGKPIPQVSLSRVGSASVLGLRNQNEDRLRFARIHDNLLYFAVFDGHGGPHAADYCYTFMEKFIRGALEEEDDLEKVLKKAFLDADKCSSVSSSSASFLTAGTTATVAMLRDGIELVVGSVGDSRAMLCRKGRANKLTKDHTPDRKDERHRIQRFGGFVTWNSVGQANVNGRLAMTRSIGDFHLKSSGVIAEPDTQRLTALQYGSEDNSTIIIVPLGAWGKHQSSTIVYSMSRNFVSSGRWA